MAAADDNRLFQDLRACFKDYPDFPKKGILFRDIHPVMRNAELRGRVLDFLVERYKDQKLNAVVGLESRGYYFGIPLAFRLNLPFIAVRKAGKLPGQCESIEYGLEYGKDKMEVQLEGINPGDRVVILDDLLATGVFGH